ncbi:MAG TPA: hypothetical protein VFL92_06425 [Sphingomonas sp.]|nr:hypothetical protein [Sphingomonas sp.]
MAEATIVPYVPLFVVMGIACGMLGIIGWMFTTWFRVKHGYPLENQWGKAIYPQKNPETEERVKLLTQENAQLRAELGSLKDRLANVERIVTDGAYRLDREIDGLCGAAN